MNVKKYLDVLMNAKEPVVWQSDDAKKLQYLIHNGFYVAELKNMDAYSSLRTKWKIRYKGKFVTASPMSIPKAVIEYENITDAFDIVDKLSKLKTVKQEIKFKNARLTDRELKLVTNWCNANKKICMQEESGDLYVR